MTADTVDLEEWFTDLFAQISKPQLQTLVVAKQSYIGGLPDATKAAITKLLAPHHGRLLFVTVLAIRTRIKDNPRLTDLAPTLATREGQEWLAVELGKIRALANAKTTPA